MYPLSNAVQKRRYTLRMLVGVIFKAGFFFITIKKTESNINIIPAQIRKLKCSWKTKTPKNTAVTGSNAPIIADKVGPIILIETVIVSNDTMVGIMANATTHTHASGVWSICKSAPKCKLNK